MRRVRESGAPQLAVHHGQRVQKVVGLVNDAAVTRTGGAEGHRGNVREAQAHDGQRRVGASHGQHGIGLCSPKDRLLLHGVVAG